MSDGDQDGGRISGSPTPFSWASDNFPGVTWLPILTRKEAAMSAPEPEQQQPEPPTDYPPQWRPSWVREKYEQRDEFEERVANLSDTDLQRIRKGQ